MTSSLIKVIDCFLVFILSIIVFPGVMKKMHANENIILSEYNAKCFKSNLKKGMAFWNFAVLCTFSAFVLSFLITFH